MEPEELRRRLWDMLGIPRQRCPLDPEGRGALELEGMVVEKWVWTSEPGSRVPSVLYRPADPVLPMPAVAMTCGHGGSKSQWQYVYVPQVYARLGLACLVLDPIGEEERHCQGKLGTRAHDPEAVHLRADAAGRLIMGKLVFDTMRGLDFLFSRDDVDPLRVGVAGNSLGGAKASWMLALDVRLRLALVSGWAYGDLMVRYGKFCTRVPNQRLRRLCSWPEFLALAAPRCAVRVLNGDADVIIDRDGDGTAWRQTRAAVAQAAELFAARGAPDGISCWFEAGGGHRPYHGYPEALASIHRHLGTPGWSLEQIRALPTINSGAWCDASGVVLEKLYGTELHQRGAALPDVGVRQLTPRQLTCLRDDEAGAPEYTLEGWLDAIDPGGGGDARPT